MRSIARRGSGAQIYLVLELPGRHGLWAIEIKRGSPAGLSRGFHNAREDLKPKRSFVVNSSDEHFPITKDVTAIGLSQMASMLQEL